MLTLSLPPFFLRFVNQLSSIHQKFIVLVICLLAHDYASAQSIKRPDSVFCASPELSEYQRIELDKMAKLAFRLKQTSDKAFTGITHVPIRPHIFRTADSKGGFDLARLNNAIALTNSYYQKNGVGIQFYLAGTSPDYIDNDAMYQVFTDFNESGVNGRDATNAMNMYFVNAFTSGGLQGYAYFPENTLGTTRSFILATPTTENTLGNFLIPHELGHNFNLYHTFQGSTSSTPELVTRGDSANCTTAGDLLCDTPADPYNRSGSYTTYINNCLVYSGTATDPKGMTYSPSMSNLMSYYNSCTHDFTQGQYDRMQEGLALRLTHTAYTLDYPPSPVTAPNQLTAVAGTTGNIILSWQDNSSNEMGFFIERASSSGGPFMQIGGTAPNVSSFTDARTGQAGTFYYRVRPSNTTLDALSNIAVTTISIAPACTLTPGIGCVLGDGLNSIQLNGATLSHQSGCSPNAFQEYTATSVSVVPGQTCSITGQFLNGLLYTGVAVWLDLNRDGQFSSNERVVGNGGTGSFSAVFTVPTNLTAGPVAMRIAGVRGYYPYAGCDSYTYGETEDYTIQVIANACPTITGLATTNITTSSAQLSWNPASDAFSYELRWKAQSASDWTVVSDLSTTNFLLSNLATGTGYQWQVKAICASGASVYAGSSFVSLCPLPTNLTTSQITTSSAVLSWSTTGDGRTYDLAWRAENSSTWTIVDGLTTSSYSLTGLREGTIYVWQVRSTCTPTGSQNYTNPASFNTQGICRPLTAYGCLYNNGLNSLVFNNQTITQSNGCSTSGYRNNTLINVPVTAGRSYSFSGTLISSNYSEGFSIWLDINRNGLFESGERVFSTSSLVIASFSGSLTIPASTTAGLLPMRVVVTYGTTPYDACGNYAYSETEDFLLNVHSSNTVQITQRTQPVCYNSPLAVSFATTIPFSQNNVFSLQLSDNNGSFSSPNTVGSVTGTSGGSLTVTIPATLPVSSNYLLRVVSSSPALTNTPTTPLTIDATCSCPTPTALSSVTNTNGGFLLSWQCDASTSSFLVRWRKQGASTWSAPTTVNDLQFQLSGLSSNSAYEWQVQANCLNGQTSGWTTSATIQTPYCGIAYLIPSSVTLASGQTMPLSISVNATAPWSATINRDGSNWWSISNAYSTTFSLNTTVYQSSTYTLGNALNSCGTLDVSGVATAFVPCTPPASLTEADQTYTTIYLRWAYESGKNYQIQWKESGAATWNESGTYCCSSYYVSNLQNGKTYQWRIRSACSGGAYSDWSTERTFTMSCPVPFGFSEQMKPTSVQLYWGYMSTSTGNSLNYNLQWRAVGTTAWTSLTNVCCYKYTLNTLTKGQAYEWRLQTICPDGSTSAYSSPRTFTATCGTPTGLFYGNQTSTSVRLYWTSQSGISHTIQYRPRTTPAATWSSISGITGSAYNLTGLTNGLTYEWQLQAVCSAEDSSPFSASSTFSTYCSTPYFYTPTVSAQSATLSWSDFGPTARYSLTYRPVSSATTTTISNLTTTTYSLTGLTNGVVYQAQIQLLCSDGNVSGLSSPLTFTTNCNAPEYSGINSVYDASASVYWQTSAAGVTYEVAYRQQGTTTWLPSLTTTSSSFTIPNLTPQTAYEWRVRTLCTDASQSAWKSGNSFTTTACNPPSYLSENYMQGGSVLLNWSSNQTDAFLLQWRPLGLTEWNSVTVVGALYSLTGLSSGSSYEWRLQRLCSDVYSSSFSAPRTFTTYCFSPSTKGESYITDTSAEVYWIAQMGVRYQVRWRRTGTSTWTTSQTLAYGYNGYAFYSLSTTLVAGTAYEWQIQAICTDDTPSGYSSSRTFTARCTTSGLLTYRYITEKSIQVVWGGSTSGLTYEVRWRLRGTTSWTGSATATTNTYTLTGLTGNTEYEIQIKPSCSIAIWSNTLSLYTAGNCGYLNSNFALLSVNSQSATIDWGAFSGILSSSVSWQPIGTFNQTSINAVTTNPYTITGLSPNTAYVLSVNVNCQSGGSGQSLYFITQLLPTACSAMYTLVEGSWTNPAIWSCNRVPTSSDAVEIRHAVTIPANTTGNAQQVRYTTGGRLINSSGATLRIGF